MCLRQVSSSVSTSNGTHTKNNGTRTTLATSTTAIRKAYSKMGFRHTKSPATNSESAQTCNTESSVSSPTLGRPNFIPAEAPLTWGGGGEHPSSGSDERAQGSDAKATHAPLLPTATNTIEAKAQAAISHSCSTRQPVHETNNNMAKVPDQYRNQSTARAASKMAINQQLRAASKLASGMRHSTWHQSNRETSRWQSEHQPARYPFKFYSTAQHQYRQRHQAV